MMEPLLARLSDKDHLDVSDASDLLQFLQNQTEPILSHHTAPLSTKCTTGANRSSSLAEAVHTRATGAVVGSEIRPHHSSDLAQSATIDDSNMRGEIFHSVNFVQVHTPGINAGLSIAGSSGGGNQTCSSTLALQWNL